MKQRCNMMHYYKLYYLNKADLLKQAKYIYFFTHQNKLLLEKLKNMVWLILWGGEYI